jgi:hypothetical protein
LEEEQDVEPSVLSGRWRVDGTGVHEGDEERYQGEYAGHDLNGRLAGRETIGERRLETRRNLVSPFSDELDAGVGLQVGHGKGDGGYLGRVLGGDWVCAVA